jgi:hypothetical protein
MGRSITLSVAALLVVSVAACGGDGGEGTAAPAGTEAPPPTETSEVTASAGTEAPPPTETSEVTASAGTEAPPAADTSEIIEITFGGSECTAAGPSEVPAGNRVFLVTNVSDLGPGVLFVRRLVDGHTFQDALDLQGEFGGPGAYFPRQMWFADVRWSNDHPEMDVASNQRLQAYSLEPGTHLVAYETLDPVSIWLCAPLDVVEP